MTTAAVMDFVYSRYHNTDHVLSLSIDDFIELYAEAKESKKINDLWLAYVVWRPENMTFEQFVNQKPEEVGGVYIDQIGL